MRREAVMTHKLPPGRHSQYKQWVLILRCSTAHLVKGRYRCRQVFPLDLDLPRRLIRKLTSIIDLIS